MKRANNLLNPNDFYKDLFNCFVNNSILRLNLMEAPFPFTKEERKELMEDISEVAFSEYPDPNYYSLKSNIRDACGYSKQIDFIFGNGAFENITSLLVALRQSTETAMLFTPTFYWFRQLTKQLHYKEILFETTKDKPLVNEEVLIAIKNKQPGIIIIVSPNNPTAKVFDHGLLEMIVKSSSGLILIDQIYASYAGISYKSLLEENSNVILIDSLSKKGFAALRFSFMAFHRKLEQKLAAFTQPFPINEITSILASRIYTHYSKVEKQMQTTISERDKLIGLLKHNDNYIVDESATNFINFSLKDSSLNQSLFNVLRDKGFLLNLYPNNPCAGYLAQYLRLTINTPQVNQEVYQILSEFGNSL